jgi:hypothetical protein
MMPKFTGYQPGSRLIVFNTAMQLRNPAGKVLWQVTAPNGTPSPLHLTMTNAGQLKLYAASSNRWRADVLLWWSA